MQSPVILVSYNNPRRKNLPRGKFDASLPTLSRFFLFAIQRTCVIPTPVPSKEQPAAKTPATAPIRAANAFRTASLVKICFIYFHIITFHMIHAPASKLPPWGWRTHRAYAAIVTFFVIVFGVTEASPP